MIGYCDLGMMAFIRQVVFGDKPWVKGVVWAPVELSRQKLAVNQAQANTGTPGIAIFRTDLETDKEQENWYAQTVGVRQGIFKASPGGQANRIRYIMQKATYSVICWAESESDLNAMERALTFSTVNQLIDYTIADAVGVPMPTKFHLDQDPRRSRSNVKDPNTGEIIIYSVMFQFYANAPWILSYRVPLIESIVTMYKDGLVPNVVYDTITQNATTLASGQIP